jgi:hypothetical protein
MPAPLLFTCPNCNVMIEVVALNCGVFRCGIYRDDGLQVNPHLPQAECEKLGDSIYGCGKPFQILNGKIIKCAFI